MSAGAACLLRRFAAAARGSRPLGGPGAAGRCASVSLSTLAMGKSSGPKFYAVRRGRSPGVFHTWAECEQQVKGFAGAVHKSFQTQAAAAAYVAGVNAVSPTAAAERKRRPRSRSASPGAAPRRRLHRAAGGDAEEAAGHRGALDGFTHTLQFDGGARGNPGPAGAGAVLLCDARGAPVAEAGVWLGPHSTCNEAEYTGLIAGLRLAARCGVQRLRVQGDSTLVTRQMKGEWRCSAPGLMPLQAQAAQAATAFEAIHYAYIPRAENARADALANRAMDLRESFDAVDAALLPQAQPASAA